MLPRFFLLLSLTLATVVEAQDRSLQANTETAFDQFANRPKIIVPGLMVYGVPWTATIDEFKSAFGPPTGIFAIRSDAVALVYGKTHVLLFEKGELREVSIDSRLFNYVLDPHILPHVFFDTRDMAIDPGIRLGMSPEEILELLPGKFAAPGERENTSMFALPNASVRLWYSIVRRPGQKDSRAVMGITVRGL